MIKMTRHVNHVFFLTLSLLQWCDFSRFSCIYTRLNHRRIRYKKLMSEEYSTVDKLGSEKLLARKSCFSCRINRLLISYLSSSKRDFKFLRAFLLNMWTALMPTVFFFLHVVRGCILARHAGISGYPSPPKFKLNVLRSKQSFQTFFFAI